MQEQISNKIYLKFKNYEKIHLTNLMAFNGQQFLGNDSSVLSQKIQS